MIKAVIFDCFGVVISDALTVMCDELEQQNPSAVSKVWELVAEANRNEITSDESSLQVAEIFGMTLEQYRAELQERERKNEALLAYILELRRKYKVAMLSNVPRGSLERRFAADELGKYFDQIVASGEIGYAKPESEAYQLTAERLGVQPEECVFIDDRQVCCMGAEAMGMRAVEYRSFAQFKRDLEAILANS